MICLNLGFVTVSCYSRDQLDREKRNQQLRQRNMVYELARTFFIKAVNDKHTICNVVLPNDLMIERKPLAECNEEDIHEELVGTMFCTNCNA